MINIEREKSGMNEYKTMNLWLLVTSINLTLFAISQMEPSRMKQLEKMRYNNLRQANQTFITAMTSVSSPDVRAALASMSFDSVGLIVELMGMTAQVHPEQQEWFIREVQKLIFQSVNKQSGAKV
jgi:phosphoribosylformylglycinamidine (FGAM) synthase-like enzyme